jgi:Carboxypeptidase regulatory-like domain
MFRQVRTLLVSFFILVLCSLAYGQNAQIQGLVTDSSGAILSKAQVRVVDQRTQTERQTETNGHGEYAVPGLNPSIYKLFVSASGFSPATSSVITLNVEQVAVLDFKLQVGEASSQVIVNAEDAEINTTDASVSTVIDRQFAENLPLNGRTFQSLIYLTPGVTLNTGGGVSGGFAMGQFSVNGERASSNYWTVDGVSANIGMSPYLYPSNGAAGGLGAFNVLGGTNGLVSVDALQEFRIQTSTYAPEFGRTPGGQISIATRSGTNQFHGALFDYFRNTALDATDWFADHNGLPKAAEHQNDFGGVVGGPVMKDKMFFFFSYEGLRLRLPQSKVSTVPDLASRQLAIPAMQPWLNAYPLPNVGAPDVPCSPTIPCTDGVSGIAPFNSGFSNPASVDAYGIRVDYALTKSLNLFGRYNRSPSSYAQTSPYLTANTIFSIASTTDTRTIGSTWSISPAMVNEVRFNYSTSGGKTTAATNTCCGGTVFPLADLIPAPFTLQNSNMSIGTSFGSGMIPEAGTDAHNVQHQYNVVDMLSMQKGSHSLKFGIDYRRLSPKFGPSLYSLSSSFATMADMEAGRAAYTGVTSFADVTFLFHNLSLFAQDTWRPSPRLTLTYGLRWDVDFTPSTEDGPALPALVGFSQTDFSNLALAPVGTSVYPTRYGNVAPRFGGAYQFVQRPGWELVLRSGFGVFYDLASTEVGNQNVNYIYPYGNSVYTYGTPFPTPPALQTPQPIVPPDATQGTLFGFDPHLNLPYSLQWSGAVEQALGREQTLTLSYLGSVGKRLLASAAITAPNPNYLSADLVANAGHANYNALQVQFQRRLSRGIQSLVSYTWSHAIDTGSFGAYADGSFANMEANRANSDFDTRNTLSAAFTYDVPAYAGNAVMKAISGGWSTENIIQVHSAQPVNVIDGGFVALTSQNSAILIRPDVVPGQPLYLYGSQYPGRKALNPDAFTHPPLAPAGCIPGGDIACTPTRQGDLGRNALTGFGLAQWDFAAHREFPIYEAVKLQFRAEMFNILNHPNFGSYNSVFGLGDPFFGQATQMLGQSLVNDSGLAGNGSLSGQYQLGAPRSIQLALKVMF